MMRRYKNFDIRYVRPEEAEQAAAVEAACFPPHEACRKDRMLARVAAAPDYFLVAVDRETGTVAGMLNGLATDEEAFRDEFFVDASLHNPSGKNVLLLGLAVLPAYRRLGLASELMRTYLQAEQERGRETVLLTCLDSRVPMYRHMGFIDLGESASRWGGERWHEMSYTVNPPRDPEAQERVTREGDPRRPRGEAGGQMLSRMNRSHAELTGWALGFWQIGEDDEILDIGCGGGAALRRMAESVESGHLTGVDYSPVSVEMSRKTNAEAVREGKMTILEASVEALPFADGVFDKVITVESFYFWPDPAANLREVRRVLKPGGLFLLVADIYQNGALSADTEKMAREYELFNPTEEEFMELFLDAGFSRVEIHTEKGRDWICVEGQTGTAV